MESLCKYGVKSACTYYPEKIAKIIINEAGRTVADALGTYARLGKFELCIKILKPLITKGLLKVTLKGVLIFTFNGIGIAADIIQSILEWKGYKKTGKAVGLLGNVAVGAVVGGITGGPIGAVVGGVGGLAVWGIGEIIGGIINRLFKL